MKKSLLAFGVTQVLLFSSSLHAQSLDTEASAVVEAVETSATLSEDEIKQQEYLKRAEEFEASLTYQTGNITLPGGKATLNVPDDYYYLSPQDAKRVLEEAWGNPEGELTLGMLFPQEYSALDAASWGVTIEYAEDGYVSDEDAADIDYDDLLEEMKKDTKTESELRQEQGYPSIELVGWAEQPYYDTSTHKLYWAKELIFDSNEEHTLNYNVRALGRQGYLVMNFIANMGQLEEVNGARDEVLAMVSFNDGHKYSQFDPDIDNVAAYGIGGLIAGKVLAKTGFLALALVFLKKFWFALLLPVYWLKNKFFSKKEAVE